MEVAIHRVLIERDEDVDLIPHVAHGRIARANGQKGVSVADDRLIGVVGVEMEPTAREDAGENIPRGRCPDRSRHQCRPRNLFS
jgi:hypothetical protein